MESATANIGISRFNKLFGSALLFVGGMIWLAAATAHATPNYSPYTTHDSYLAVQNGFQLVQVQGQELNWNIPDSLGELISTVPESLKLDLTARVNRMFHQIFETNMGDGADFEAAVPIELPEMDAMAGLPEGLLPLTKKESSENAVDSVAWPVFDGNGEPGIHRQMYRTDI